LELFNLLEPWEFTHQLNPLPAVARLRIVFSFFSSPPSPQLRQ
jgi:hypothetical protein